MNAEKSIIQSKGWIVLLPLGIILIIAGIIQGDYLSVLGKAVRICLECVGIG